MYAPDIIDLIFKAAAYPKLADGTTTTADRIRVHDAFIVRYVTLVGILLGFECIHVGCNNNNIAELWCPTDTVNGTKVSVCQSTVTLPQSALQLL